MSIEAFQQMPVTFTGLVVESTTRCNAKCAMCYQSSGPKGSDQWGKHALKTHEIRGVISSAAGIETLQKRFHLAGGEAFLRVDECVELFAHARDEGFTNITTTTNAYWAAKPSNADEIVRRARTAGLTGIEISWDVWHLPYIKPEAVANCIRASASHGLRSNLRVLTTKNHFVEEILGTLPDDAVDALDEISSCPVFPTGRAATDLDRKEIFHTGDLGSTCHSILNLTVNARGDVYPCCAGADQTDWLSFGNIRRSSVAEIASVMEHSQLLRVLVFLGPGALVPILREAGVNIERESLAGICHLCWTIFSNPEYAKIINKYFDDLEEESRIGIIAAARQMLEPTGAHPR